MRLNERYSTFWSVESPFRVLRVNNAEKVFVRPNGRYSTFWSVESQFRVLTLDSAEKCLLGLMGAIVHFGVLKVHFVF